MAVLIIAEAGVNHNGSVEIAKELCKKAKEIGADAIKFQTFLTEELITAELEQAEYQKNNSGKTESQFSMLKRLELSQADFREIKDYCEEIGICFASTAFDTKSLDFLVDLGIPFIKISSGELGNIPFLRKIGGKNLPIILSTGMGTLGEIEISLAALRQGGAKDITLLHCTSNYPCPFDDVNLRAMETLKQAFGCPIGYSDHTLGIEVAIAAAALGAVVIEKHFTLDKNMAGPDHLASTEPADFAAMIAAVRNIEKALGDGLKQPTKAEKKVAKVVTKRIVANCNISKGEILKEANLTTKRSKTGIAAKHWDEVVGRVATRDYKKNEIIQW